MEDAKKNEQAVEAAEAAELSSEDLADVSGGVLPKADVAYRGEYTKVAGSIVGGSTKGYGTIVAGSRKATGIIEPN